MIITIMQSGDLLLCQGKGFISSMLQWVGQSKYSHVGIVLYQPIYLCETLSDGWYVWDASYSYTPEEETQKILYGVQIHKLKDIISLYGINNLFLRRVTAPRDYQFFNTIETVHKEIHAKPYDLHIMDWISAKVNMVLPFSLSTIFKHTDRFWCSALVSYIYFRLGWITDVNWSIIAPREYSSTECTGQLLFTSIISDEEPLVTYRQYFL